MFNRIEGRAPDGVEVGDVANYFNAEAGDMMQVVSWTGMTLNTTMVSPCRAARWRLRSTYPAKHPQKSFKQSEQYFRLERFRF
ncbi:MAG: hypothetical protein WDN00_08275 [Limisphaerales bacterium]